MTLSRLLDRARFASRRGDVVEFKRCVIRLLVQLRRYAEAEETKLELTDVDSVYDSYITRNEDEDDLVELQLRPDVSNEEARDSLLEEISPLVENGP